MATEQAAAVTPPVVDTGTPAAAEPAAEAHPAAPADTTAADLAAAVAEHAAKLDEGLVAKPAANANAEEPAKPAEGEAAVAEGDKPADAEKPKDGEAAKPGDEKQPEAKPDDKPNDETAATIAKYLRQNEKAIAREKEAKNKVAQLEKDRADFVKQQEAFAQTQAVVNRLVQLVQTRPAEAIENLLGTAALLDENSTVITDLIEHVKALREGRPTVSPEEKIAAEVQKRFDAEKKAREDAETKAREADAASRKTKRDQVFSAYLTGLATEFETNTDKYPFLQDDPLVKAEYPQIDRFVQGYFDQNHKLPTGDEVLSHFNGLREKRALSNVAVLRKTGKLPVETTTAQSTPATRPASAAVVPAAVDSRGKPTVASRERSLEEERDDIAKRLDAQFRH